MDSFQFAVALDNNWENLTEECIRQITPLAPNTNFGFIYTTDYLADKLPNIIHLLKSKTGIDHWVGTVGIGICAGDSEIYGTPAITIMVSHFDENNYKILSLADSGLTEFIGQQTEWLNQNQQHFGVIHGDPRSADTNVIVNQVSRFIPNSYFVGGLSSSQSTYPQVAGLVCDSSVSGVLFNEKIKVLTSMTQGCSPISERHIITECDRNFIYKINDEPALDVFKRDIGEVLSRDLQKVAGYIFIGLPVERFEGNDYKIRNLMGIDINSDVLIVGDIVEKDQVIQFCKRDNQTAWQDHIDTLITLKKRITSPIRGALYYSCLGRGKHLFGDESVIFRLSDFLRMAKYRVMNYLAILACLPYLSKSPSKSFNLVCNASTLSIICKKLFPKSVK